MNKCPSCGKIMKCKGYYWELCSCGREVFYINGNNASEAKQ